MSARRLVQLTAVSVFALSLGVGAALAQEESENSNPPWPVPAEAVKVKNPVKSTPDGLAATAKIYHDNCLTCHGEAGHGDGPASENLVRKPANFTDKAFMGKQTDGEIFFKMTKGRAPMPSWEKKFSDEERWGLVNYIRSLAK